MKFIKETNRVIYVNDLNEVLAYVTFPEVQSGVVEIDHTVVDPSLRGQGIAGKLLENAYEVIKENHLKCIPTCSYAVNWFSKNESKKDILK